MDDRKDFKKIRAERLNSILSLFGNSPSILYTHNTFDSAKLPRIYPSNVSNWRKGGYTDKKTNKIKEYITESSAQNIITVLNYRMKQLDETNNNAFRIEYLLGYDDYMTTDDIENSIRNKESFKKSLEHELLDSISFLLISGGYRAKKVDTNTLKIYNESFEINLSNSDLLKFANHIKEYACFMLNKIDILEP